MRSVVPCVVVAVLGTPVTACGRYLALGEDTQSEEAPTEPATTRQAPSSSGGDPSSPSSSGDDATAPAAVDGGAAPVPRLVFVTSKVYTADSIRGLNGADIECNALAKDGLPALQNRRFVAWLSDDIQNAKNRLAGTTGPWNLVDGRRVADDVAHLVGTKPLANAIDVDETGDSTDGYAWTGTNRSSTAWGMNCVGWTMTSGNGVVGQLVPDATKWTAAKTEDCGGGKKTEERPKHHLYCFERVP